MKKFVCVAMLACLGFVGCESESANAPIAFDSVPQAMRDKAKETLPDVEFDQAIRRSDGGYELRGKDKSGKVRDVEFSEDGKVIEIE
jgi:hypothetical protein